MGTVVHRYKTELDPKDAQRSGFHEACRYCQSCVQLWSGSLPSLSCRSLQYRKMISNVTSTSFSPFLFRRQARCPNCGCPCLLPKGVGECFASVYCRVDGWRGAISGPVPSVPLRTVLAPFNAHGSPVTHASYLRLFHRFPAWIFL